jgi:hypothetical protein
MLRPSSNKEHGRRVFAFADFQMGSLVAARSSVISDRLKTSAVHRDLARLSRPA